MSFGMSFGNPTTSVPTFGTGANPGFGGFGTSAPAPNAQPFSFGQTNTTAPSAGFSFGNLGAPTTTTTSFSNFSFSNPTTSAQQPFSFGAFGAPKTTPTFSFGGLGTTTTTAPSAGFSFGQPNLFGGAGGFPGTANTAGTMGLAAPTPATNTADLFTILSCPMLYGDERDKIIAKLNHILACYGVGKAYYSNNAPPCDLTQENPYCMFKAIGYSCISTAKPEDGLVSLIFNKKEEEVRNMRQQIGDHLSKCFGSKPNIFVVIDSIKLIPEDFTELVFHLDERTQAGSSKPVLSTEVCAFLEQANIKPQLQQIGVTNLFAKNFFARESYLESPPLGIEPKYWQQAILDNPDPEKLIPVPLIGFDSLLKRMKARQYETKQHQERLDILNGELAEQNRKGAITTAKVAECKRKLGDLQHRVLKLLVRQEIARKMGFSMLEDEEQLRTKLEAIQAELNAPTKFKGHLNELISQIRMQNFQAIYGNQSERYSIDETTEDLLKEHLRLQHEGLSHLISIVKEDMQVLKIIEDISKGADKELEEKEN